MIAPSPSSRMVATVGGAVDFDYMVASVDNGSDPDGTMTAVVSTTEMTSWESSSVYYRFRIKIDGAWVDEADLHGPLQVDEPEIGEHTGSFSFGLVGKQWSIAATEKVWARVPVEVYFDHGVAGSVVEDATPTYRGYVLARASQNEGDLPVVRVTCGDEAAYWDNAELCDEVTPLSELTRGEIVTLLAQSAGINTVTVPDGAVYNSPIQAARKRLFEILPDFVEPEGWQIEMRNGGLEVWTPVQKGGALPADWSWTKDDCISIVPESPEEAPSRWVLHATSTVETSDAGIETTITTVKLRDIYAQGYSPQQQDSAGVVTSTGFSAPEAFYRVVSIVTIRESRRGDQLVMIEQEEVRWHWIHTGKIVSNGSTGGTAGGGFNYNACYINEDGDHVVNSHAKLGVTGKRITHYFYDSNGTKTGQRIQTFELSRGPSAGVRNVGDSDDETAAADIHVYDDDQSYEQNFESLFMVSDIRETLVYDDEGRGVGSDQTLYTRYPVQCHINGPAPTTSYWINYQGNGQTEQFPTNKVSQVRSTRKILTSDGVARGETVAFKEYRHVEKADGDWDWGGFNSNYVLETFGHSRSEQKFYTSPIEGEVEVETITPAKGREVNLILGNLPITDYEASVWTRITTQPLELVVEDALAEAWFGFSRETISHDYVQTLDEARAVIRRRRQRLLSQKAIVTRVDNGLVQRGDTVYLYAPNEGIAGRFIITAISRTWGGAADPVPRATYVLEDWSAVS